LVHVITAQSADFPAWLTLAAEVEPLFGPLVNDPAFLSALERNIKRGTAFCVRKEHGQPGSKLLGGILFSPKPPNYTIGWLAVAQVSRRQGIGRLLVEYILTQVRRPGIITVTTFAPGIPEGQPARLFYEQLGFVAAESAPDGPEGGGRQIFRRFVV
jgi:GNAT superfamily N-acetyltransferase